MSFAEDTLSHIQQVRSILQEFNKELQNRGKWHDYSKFSDEEQKIFSDVLDGKQSAEYGTPEYNEVKKKLAPALEHHYKENRHHPEHYKNGISGMTLIDLLEMVADWKSATNRHKEDNIEKSIEINARRYNIEGQLKQILINTIKEM